MVLELGLKSTLIGRLKLTTVGNHTSFIIMHNSICVWAGATRIAHNILALMLTINHALLLGLQSLNSLRRCFVALGNVQRCRWHCDPMSSPLLDTVLPTMVEGLLI